jgi:hypothetical protein
MTSASWLEVRIAAAFRPSRFRAHVASTTAVALVLTRFLPVTGAIFWRSRQASQSAHFRYHCLDVALGAIEAAAVFLVCLLVFRP